MNSFYCCLLTVKMYTLSLDSECFYQVKIIRLWPISLCLLCLVCQAMSDLCPYGWLHYSGTSYCYYISSDSSQKIPIKSVTDRCKWMDSEIETFDHLAMLIRSDEYSWLTGKLQPLSKHEDWWLGYASTADNIELAKSSNIVASILNSSSADQRKKLCFMYTNSTPLLNDCRKKKGYICKRKENLPMKCDIGNGWTYIEGLCLKYVSRTATWENAKKYCEMTFDARMANIQSLQQKWYVWSHANTTASAAWNGFSFNNKVDQFQWTDGSPLIQWLNDSKPDASNKSDTCGLIDGTKEITSAWTTGNCNDEHTFTCMKPSGVCAEGWNTIEDTCFKLFVEPELTWIKARDYCNEIGAQLLKITSQEIQDEVLLTARAMGNSLEMFWIGISDETGNFTWTDGTVANFTFWDEDPHQRYKGNRRGYINMGNKNGRWRTRFDSLNRPFGCSMSRNSLNTDVTSHSIFICESYWTRSGDSCVSSEQNKMSWPEANSTCDKLQSQLLNINADTYLGDLYRENGYWVSKEIADKNDLANLNISLSYQGNGSCPLLINNETEIKIQDSSCNNTNHFYCEKPPVDSADYYLTSKYDAECGMMFFKRPGTDLCYQFRQAKMTWPHALQHCIDQNSSLASITTSEEQKYIEDKLSVLHFLQFWIGASDRREMFKIQWEDGNPFIYSNWEKGKPEFRNVPNCIGINSDSMKWNDYSCYLSIGFICKKKASQVTTTTPSTPRVLPSNFYNGCAQGWHMYGRYCYQINTQDELFDDAVVNCKNQNSTLASIHSKGENGFLWSLLLPDKRYWIDSISKDNNQDMTWSDTTILSYINFPFSPMIGRGQSTYLSTINQKTGKWHSMATDDIAEGYICKKPNDIVSSPHVKQYSTGCMEEGYAYAEYCYTMYDSLTSWDEAQKFCGLQNGNLAVVSDSVTNDFLSSVFGHINGSNFWIGLSVVKGKRNWVRQILPSQEFWERQFTGNDDGCASMNSTLPYWQLKNCSSLFRFVCETVRKGFTTQTVPTTTTTVTPTLETCPSGWIYNGGLCYKIFASGKSWHEARYHCESLGGNLPSIHDESTNSFITSLLIKNLRFLRAHLLIHEFPLWIGLHDNKIEKAFEWSDGSPLDFSRWSDGEPNSYHLLEDCAEIRKHGMWNDDNCYYDLSYVCSIKSGSQTMSALISTTPAPRCHDTDWIYHNGFCYFFNDDLKTWQDAETDCLSRGGHLASVLSEEENRFIIRIQEGIREYTEYMWIGYNRLNGYSFVWSDGKPKGFEIFFVVTKSNCVSINIDHGGWYTQSCDRKLEYICKKINESTVSTVPTTTQRIEKVCPSGFVGSDEIDKCYAVVESRVNWRGATRACEKMSSKLASINSDQEQYVVNMLASGQRIHIWIGLRYEDGSGTSLTWQDGSPVAYTKWSSGFPTFRKYPFPPGWPHRLRYEPSCVTLSFGKPLASWEDTKCDHRYYYLCQTPATFRTATITESFTSSSSASTVNNPDAQSSSTTTKSADVSTKSPNVDSFNDQFNDHPSTITVNTSSYMSKDRVQFTSLTDTVTKQLSNATTGNVNFTSLRSNHKVSDDSLTKTDTALIVLGLLALVSGISFVVTKIVRLKRRRAQIPVRPVSKDGGFYNVLYSSIHEPDHL